MNFPELYRAIQELPNEILNAIVIELLEDGKVDYTIVSQGHLAYIKRLKEKQSEDYNALTQKVIRTFVDYKYKYDENINECIRYLYEKGRINLTLKQRAKVGIDDDKAAE